MGAILTPEMGIEVACCSLARVVTAVRGNHTRAPVLLLLSQHTLKTENRASHMWFPLTWMGAEMGTGQQLSQARQTRLDTSRCCLGAYKTPALRRGGRGGSSDEYTPA